MAAGGQLLSGASPSPSVTSSSPARRRPSSTNPSPPPTPSSTTSTVTALDSDLEGPGSGSSNSTRARHLATSTTDSSSRTGAPAPGTRPHNNSNGGKYSHRSDRSTSKHRLHRDRAGADGTIPSAPAAVHPSILQPRVAVVLNVPPVWHPWLFALRLLSCLPAVWWGLPSALHLLLRFLPGPEHNAFSALYQADGGSEPYALTETALATIWCFACGYLSFFFTDCLMSRWLINYTPQATIVRLLTIDVINAYITLTTLSLCGGFQDPRLLLPGWIGIATTLTVCYHISHQRINIRKETSTSVNVFSIASYLSMVALLAHMLASQPDYPTMPVVAHGKRLYADARHLVSQIKGTIERERAEL